MSEELVKNNNTVIQHTEAEIKLIHDMFAKNTTPEEFKLFLYTADRFGLDPMLKQIWCVKFANSPAQIYAGRDGFLEIAHTRSGNMFNGMESGMKDTRTAYCRVYRKDMEHPFYVEVSLEEYSTGQALWKTKPKTMLIKVAESQCLRKAFSISGIYSPEEMSQWELDTQGIKYTKQTGTNEIPAKTSSKPPVVNSKATSGSGDTKPFDRSKLDPNAKPPTKAHPKTGKIYCPTTSRLYAMATKDYGIPAEEFKSFCFNITNKEHSSDYTNKNCWDIEDAIIETANKKKEEVATEVVEVTELIEDENLDEEFDEVFGKEEV